MSRKMAVERLCGRDERIKNIKNREKWISLMMKQQKDNKRTFIVPLLMDAKASFDDVKRFLNSETDFTNKKLVHLGVSLYLDAKRPQGRDYVYFTSLDWAYEIIQRELRA